MEASATSLMRVRQLVAWLGGAMFACGALLSVAWSGPQRSPAIDLAPVHGEQVKAPEPSLSEAQALVFPAARTLLQLRFRGPDDQQANACEQYFEAAANRINGLSAAAIVLDPPDARDGIASLRFTGPTGQRWVVHLHLIVERLTRSVRLEYQIVEPLGERALSACDPHENFESVWASIQAAISLPLLDAATDQPDIAVTLSRGTEGSS